MPTYLQKLTITIYYYVFLREKSNKIWIFEKIRIIKAIFSFYLPNPSYDRNDY